ncbi:MAG: carbohydrate kinase family protein [Candidatus Saccharimonadales bacterium]
MGQQKQIDVISVGDIVTDDFIKLLDDQARVDDDNGTKRISMEFGLKLPFDHSEVLIGVGNAPNAAVNFAKLGLSSSLITNLGNDQRGRDMVVELEKKNVGTHFVKQHAGHKSNYHYVLWYGEERTILINHEPYPYHWPHITPREVPKWVYFSSIAETAEAYHDELTAWLEKEPSVKLAFQPGTFQIKLGAERLKALYARTELLALNREEAVLVTGGDYHNLHDLFDKLHALGPKIVLITDGPAGSYASDGTNRYKMPIYPDPSAPKERTGCGDAYTSTFVAALIKGYPIEGALQWAPITPTNVVQHVGAQQGLLDENTLKEWLAKAPDWYKVERI